MRIAPHPIHRALIARPMLLGVPRLLATCELAASAYTLVLFGLKSPLGWGALALWWFILHPMLSLLFERDRLCFYVFLRSFSRHPFYPALRQFGRQPPRRRQTIRKTRPGGL